MNKPNFLEIALRESQDGRRIFPCRGKIPAIPNGKGVLDATTDEATVVNWAGIYPDCNVGIGFFEDGDEIGMDIDLKNLPKWQEYQAQYGEIDTRIVQTGSGGYHLYFKRPQGVKLPNIPQSAGKGFELKSSGQYLIAPGSIHPDTGKEYKVVKSLPPAEMPDWLLNICLNGSKPAAAGAPQLKIPRGQHDHFLISQAGSYRRRGDSKETIVAKLRIDLERLEDTDPTNPYTDKDLERIAKSASRYAPAEVQPLSEDALSPPLTTPRPPIGYIYSPLNSPPVSERYNSVTGSVTNAEENVTERDKTVTNPSVRVGGVTKQDFGFTPAGVTPLSERVEEWIKETTAWFSYDDLDKDLGITGKDKGNRRIIIKRLKDAKLLETHPTNNKLLRHVNNSTITIEYKKGKGKQPLSIDFPFRIENYFNCYAKNIIVVAGAPDSGKTAWLLNVIKLNQAKWNIYYQSSEMGETELANRLEQFTEMELDDWKFIAEERSSHFADVIRPDDLNIIDYMELTDNVWMVAEYLREIHDKLNNGIAIVALQKKRGADLGRGGEFSLEKPRLYLSMDAGKMTIQKAKNWATSENPNRKIINFKIVRGCEFIVTNPWHDEEEG